MNKYVYTQIYSIYVPTSIIYYWFIKQITSILQQQVGQNVEAGGAGERGGALLPL